MKNQYETRDGYIVIKINTKEGVVETFIDTIDFDKVNTAPGTWNLLNIRNGKLLYVQAKINGKLTLLHRFIMNPSHDEIVDHKDGNGLMNRRYNLRNVNASINQHNRKKVKGAYYDKKNNKWKAQIMVNRKNIFIGRFNTEQEAKDATENARKTYLKDVVNE